MEEKTTKDCITAIIDAWNELTEKCEEKPQFRFPDNDVEGFLTKIWEESRAASGTALDLQVAIDSEGVLHISTGTPGIMPIMEQQALAGESVSIDCWIHTMPLVQAYFTAMTWQTIRTWCQAMNSVIALGDSQYIAYQCDSEVCKHVFYGIYRGKNAMREGRLL